MAGKRLSGQTVSAKGLKSWFFSGHSNAAKEREREIFSEFEGLSWVRVDEGESKFGEIGVGGDRINPELPYYWATAARNQVWQVWMEPPTMGSEGVEKWVMRELVAGKGGSWSLGIFPGAEQHESINWDTIIYSGIYTIPDP